MVLSLLKHLLKSLKKIILSKNYPDKNHKRVNVDFDLLKDIKSFGSEINVVFDVGACLGRYSLTISDIFPDASIHCFEPFGESFSQLKENLNNEKFTLNNFAISDESGKAKFYVNNLAETNSLIESMVTNSVIDNATKTNAEITVDVSTIENYFNINNLKCIDLLKIDVQGNTLKALKGCGDLLSSKIKYIHCEVEFLEIYKNQSLYHSVATYLYGFNYELFSLYNLHYDVNNRLSWADALFIKK